MNDVRDYNEPFSQRLKGSLKINEHPMLRDKIFQK